VWCPAAKTHPIQLPSAHDTEHFIGELVHAGLASADVHGALSLD